jgi:toxin HigB-1
VYFDSVIVTFRNKQLAALWNGDMCKIDSKFHARILARLTVLDAANRLEQLNVQGFDFHALKGFVPKRYTFHINGPWCITFEFNTGDAHAVDFEQYH